MAGRGSFCQSAGVAAMPGLEAQGAGGFMKVTRLCGGGKSKTRGKTLSSNAKIWRFCRSVAGFDGRNEDVAQ